MATAAIERKRQQRITLRNLFENQKPELSKLLPRGMSADRLFRMALTECVKNPELLECTAESWALAMQTCAAQGLYPDSGLGYMYLIPRKNTRANTREVTAMRGYQGDIALARKSGELLDIYAEVVHERDEYRVVKGLERTIEHVPYDGDEDPGKVRACYAIAKLRGGEVAWVTLNRRDIERHKKSAQGLDRTDSPWNAHEEAMWRKTAIRELFKWLPKASDASERIAQEILAAEAGQQSVTGIEAMEVPVETKPGLAGLTQRLQERTESAAGPVEVPPASREPGEDDGDDAPSPAAPPATCSHPSVPPSKVAATPKGKTVVCVECGEEFAGEAEPEKPKGGRQRRLEE